MANHPILPNLHIEAIAAEGKALGRHDGRVVFVPFAAPGDVVDVQIVKKQRGHSEGRIVKLVTPSPMRVEPFCQHFGLCGGCKWQHIPYEEQAKAKEKQVRDALERVGGFQNPPVRPILSAPAEKNYRNKLEFTFSDSRWLTDEQINSGDEFERRGLGFHLPGRFDRVLHLEECHLQPELSNEIRLLAFNKAVELNIPLFNPRSQEGILRTLVLRCNRAGDWMVVLQVKAWDERILRLLEALRDAFPAITSLQYVVNEKRNDSIYDQEVILFSGTDYIEEEMEGTSFRIDAKSFFQTNTNQAEHLYRIALEFAALTKEQVVYDLYTGTGTIALLLAGQVQKVVGIESIPEAIEAARENAERNEIDNAYFATIAVEDPPAADLRSMFGIPDVIITDPPRAGMHPKAIETILELAPERIVYVSCNPASQARDMALLAEMYELKICQPVDMFPQTHHVENVALLERKAK